MNNLKLFGALSLVAITLVLIGALAVIVTAQTVTNQTNSTSTPSLNLTNSTIANSTTNTTTYAPINASLVNFPKRLPVGKVSDITVKASGGSGNYTYQWYEISPKNESSNPALDCINGSNLTTTTNTTAICEFKPTERGPYYIGVIVTDAQNASNYYQIDPTVLVGVYANVTVLYGSGSAEFFGNATGAIANTYNFNWTVSGTFTNGTTLNSCSVLQYNDNTTGLSDLNLAYGSTYQCLNNGGLSFNLTDGNYNVTFTAADAQNITDTNSSTAQLIADWPSGISTTSNNPMGTSNTITLGQSAPLTVAWQYTGYCSDGGTNGKYNNQSHGVPGSSSCTSNGQKHFYPYTFNIQLYTQKGSSCSESGSVFASNSENLTSTLHGSSNQYNKQNSFTVSPTTTNSYCAYVNYYAPKNGGGANLIDTVGTEDPSIATINVKAAPTLGIGLTSNVTYISADQSVKITNNTSGGVSPYSYSYTVNKTSGFSISGNKIAFTSPGNYLVTIKVTDSANNMATNTVTIRVTPTLTAQLNANWTYISAGQSVKFSNTTSGGTGSDAYSFTLNSLSGVTNTGNVYTFGTAGNYLATLTITDLSGEVATSSITIQVTPPLATTLSGNRTNIEARDKVLFTNVTTGGTGSVVYTYTVNRTAASGWSESGNIFTFTNANPEPQKYIVTLNVVDKTGETASSSVLITVNESLNLNSTQVLYPGSESSGIPVFSRDQVITDVNHGAFGGVPPYTYEWYVELPNGGSFYPANCGTGATGPVSNKVPCEFATNSSSPLGQYTFKLTATDSEKPIGAVYSETELFNLNASLIITNFTANWTYISVGQHVKFTNHTGNGTGANVWTYNETSGPSGGMVYLGNNQLNFTKAGNYTIKLYVTDISGENASANAY